MHEGYCYNQPFEDSRNCEIPTFGRPIGNNGWVQCKSKSFPGKTYFFNVDSRCRTWERPVPLETPTPVVKPLNLQSDDGFWDGISIEVSDLEDDEDQAFSLEIKEEGTDEKSTFVSFKEAKRREKFAEVLFKLYHCYGEDYNGNEIQNLTLIEDTSAICKSENIKEDQDDDGEENNSSILPEICYSSSSDGELYDGSRSKNHQRFHPRYSRNRTALNYRKNCEKCQKHSVNFEASKYWRDISKTNSQRFVNSDFDDASITIDRRIVDFGSESKLPLSRYGNAEKNCRDSGQFSEDDEKEDDDDDNDKENEDEEIFRIKKENIDDSSREDDKWEFFLPRLKPLEFTDFVFRRREIQLINKKNQQRKRRATRKRKIIDEISVKSPSKKITKIIYEMNGVRTINYDFVTPELPPGVKQTSLSDTGSSSIEMAYSGLKEEKTTESVVNDINGRNKNGFFFPDDLFDIREPCLSDTSTSNCSSGSSSSSSSSSSGDNSSKNSVSSGGSGESDSSESSSSSSSSSSTGSSSFGSTSVNSTFSQRRGKNNSAEYQHRME